MKLAEPGSVASRVRCGATRRSVLCAAAVGLLAGLPGLTALAAAAPSKGALIDVLERPAPPVRIASSAPMLRVVRCGRRLVSLGERGIVLLSDDDGQHWQQAQVPVSVTLTAAQFTSARRGFAVGHSGVVLRTDDAGQTWTRVLDGRQIPALLGSPEAARQAEADGPDKPWLALHFIDDRHGMVVGAFGLAFETADGGTTWRSFAERLTNPRALHLYAIDRRGDRVWIAGEQGVYAVSTDGGRHFSALPTPYRGSFFAVCPLGDGKALLGGLRGTLLLHEGDEQFRALPPASSQGVTQLLTMGPPTAPQTSAQALALLDQSGRLFTAGLADLRFKPVPVSPDRTWLGVAQAADGAFVAASFDGVSRLQLSQPRP